MKLKFDCMPPPFASPSSRRGHKYLVHDDEIIYCVYGEDIA